MFRSVLVANRGEIACRIFRTCRRLGLRTIAVFSDADRDAPHVRMADAAVGIGPAPATDSYLRIERILDAARRTGAEAIHPGYGFLSERPAFARAVRDAGLVFVGPSAEAMELLGGKDSAKRIAEEAGVPLVPGYHGEEQDDVRLVREAAGIGVPLLIKAAAGGGGKGMRRVTDIDAFADALATCRREAEAAFGDGRVLLERWIDHPRHVEVQVFGDGNGDAVHLFERDCSLQRRHQKILEEAPAPGLPEEVRLRLGEAAVALARRVSYANAGTVEFLLDPEHRFYFIEMNTRLQVEHPVTEAVTGFDLVEWQLRIAAGEGLPAGQDAIRHTGHAFEARLYAEDPARGFVPQTGRIERLVLAHGVEGTRIDSGVEEGSSVTPYYDPMIAKLIVHGASRELALERLQHALDRSAIVGVSNNLGFLRRVVRSEPVRRAEVDTGWLDRETVLTGLVGGDDSRLQATAAFAVVARHLACPAGADPAHPCSPFDLRDGFRPGLPARHNVMLDAGAGEVDLVVTGEAGMWEVDTPQGRRRARLAGFAEPLALIEEEGMVRPVLAVFGREHVAVVDAGEGGLFRLVGTLEHAGEDEESGDLVVAPLPGRVVQIAVEPGADVERGRTLALIEAMKMEQKITAPRDGRIAEVRVEAGDQVEEGTILIVYEPAGDGR